MSEKNRLKNFRPGHAPKPTKAELHKAAQKQHEADAAKEHTEETVVVDETPKLPETVVVAVVDSGEVTAADVQVLAAVLEPQAAEAVAPVEQTNAAGGEVEQPAPPPATPPAAAEEKAAKPPKGTNEGQYVLGKRYSPKTDRNSETWGKITTALASGPKTMKELAEAVKGHNDFLGYMTRGGHIIPHKVEVAQVSG